MVEDYIKNSLWQPPAPMTGDEAQDVSSSMVTPVPTSPYLNYDSGFLQPSTEPVFIMIDGATKQTRGRYQFGFSQIGTSVMVGGAIGSLAGVYNGIKVTRALKQTGKLRRTQLLNHITKQGLGTANTLGTLATFYSVFGSLLQLTRGKDDNINTIVASTATGVLYKSTAGLKKCSLGGAIGLGISSLYVTYLLMLEHAEQEKPSYL